MTHPTRRRIGGMFALAAASLLLLLSSTSPVTTEAKVHLGAIDKVGSIYKNVRTILKQPANNVEAEQIRRRLVEEAGTNNQTSNNRQELETLIRRSLAAGSGSLVTRCFTECIEQNMTPTECQTYIEEQLSNAGGHEVGDITIKIQTPRSPEVFKESYWMVEVPVNVDGQTTCDRNGGATYYPFGWSTSSGEVPVDNVNCLGKSAGECCLAVRQYGQSSLGGKDTNGYCLGCFAHQEPLIPVCNEALGTTEYQDYVYNSALPSGSQCQKIQLTEAEVLAADATTQSKIDSASAALMSFASSPSCVGFESLLELLYDAAVVIPPLSIKIGDLACHYCYGSSDDLDVSTLTMGNPKLSSILSLLQSPFTPSTEKCVIIYTDPDGKIVDIPKLGGSRADDPYDDDCDDSEEPEPNDCPSGFYDSDGAGNCLPCAIGTYEQGGVCLPCPQGKFQSNLGQTSCDTCAPRTIAPPPGGASECTPCSEGYLEVGHSECMICPPGTCQSGELNECVPCYAGLFQPDAGQNFCLQCPRGSFTSTEGNIACDECPINWVQPNRGQTSCVQCPPGTIEGSRDRCVVG